MMIFILQCLLLLSPFEGASKTLRSNEKENENEKEKEKEKKNILSGKPNVVILKIHIFEHACSSPKLIAVLKTNTMIASLITSLTNSLIRSARRCSSDFNVNQETRIKSSSLPAPDQHLKSSTTYVLVRSRQTAREKCKDLVINLYFWIGYLTTH